MNGYADLPSLVPVIDKIIGYLNVKERVKFKSVCGSWKAEIERREQKSDTLVLHVGPYLWNMRWSQTNNGELMKFENSFEMKTTAILEHPLTRTLLLKTKKLAIVHLCQSLFTPVVSHIQKNPQAYLGYLKQCEELEIKNFQFRGTLTFELPKLKVLVMKDSPTEKLVLNCPSLEVLFWNSAICEIHFQSVKKLKRLSCFGWPASVSLDGKFESLEHLSLFTIHDQRVNGRLLNLMPKLKRFVLYSGNPKAERESIRRQQKRFGLKNLEILFSGFRDPVEIALKSDVTGFVRIDRCVGPLFDNYSKLMENSPWTVWMDYSQLFSKFKILPSDFQERFRDAYSIEISAVTNYTHLFEFLKCYPAVQQLKIHFSKVNVDRILDLAHLLQPSLTELGIVEERPSDLLKIDLSFMHRFNLVILHLQSTRIPVEFLRKVAAKRGALFNAIAFSTTTTNHQLIIYFDFSSREVTLVDNSCGSKTPSFGSVEQLIAFAQNVPHLSAFLLV